MSQNTTTNTQFHPVRQWKPTNRTNGDNKPRKRKDFTETNSNPETGVSFCIPFAFKNVGPKRVFAIFRNPKITICNSAGEEVISYDNMSLGFIERIDIKYRRDENKCVFIHFAAGRWNDNETTRTILGHLKSGMWMKIMTDDDDTSGRQLSQNLSDRLITSRMILPEQLMLRERQLNSTILLHKK